MRLGQTVGFGVRRAAASGSGGSGPVLVVAVPALMLLALAGCAPAGSTASRQSTPQDSAAGDSAGDDSGADTATESWPAGVHVPLVSLDAYSYTMKLKIGGQSFHEIIDTGSSSTGVAATGCTTCKKVDPLYVPGDTATDKGKTTESWYADGSGWSGEIWEDTAELRDLPAVSLAFAAIDEQNSFFDGTDYQGIVGLGPRELLLWGTDSLMDELTKAGVPETMAFRLCTEDGDMWIGGFDASAAASAPKFTPMVTIDSSWNPYYSVELDDLSLGGESLGLTAESFGTTVVDTGTSITYIPGDAETTLLAAVNADPAFQALFKGQTISDRYPNDCVDTLGVTRAMVDEKLPPLALTLPDGSGGTFTVEVAPSRSYLTDEGSWGFCWAFASAGARARTSLIGDTLLSGLLTVFDVEGKRIGFAPEAGCDGEASSARTQAPVPKERGPRPPGLPWYAASPHFRPAPRGLFPAD